MNERHVDDWTTPWSWACLETEEHAGYRAAWGAVQQFELQHQFPLVKQRYFESTIGRMVDKGQPEVGVGGKLKSFSCSYSVDYSLVKGRVWLRNWLKKEFELKFCFKLGLSRPNAARVAVATPRRRFDTRVTTRRCKRRWCRGSWRAATR